MSYKSNGYLDNNPFIEECLREKNIIGNCINDTSPNCKIYHFKCDNEQVVKVFDCKVCDEKEVLKRKNSFDREIKILKYLNDNFESGFKQGICKLIDCGKTEYDKDHYSYYIMPKYEQYYLKNNVIEILNDFRYLFKVLYHIHNLGYLHLDIKPKNIMIFRNKPVFIDFGCSCSIDCKDGIKCTNGPRWFRPTVLDLNKDLYYSSNDEYYKLDIYMLSKTMWAMLQNDKHYRGFYGNFEKSDMKNIEKRIGLNCEPLKILFGYTITDEIDRCLEIEKCIELINDQIKICNNEYNENDNKCVKYSLLEALNNSSPDEMIFEDIEKIRKIVGKIRTLNIITNNNCKFKNAQILKFDREYLQPISNEHFVIQIIDNNKGINEIFIHINIEKLIIKKNSSSEWIITIALSSKGNIEYRRRYTLPAVNRDIENSMFPINGDYYLGSDYELEIMINNEIEKLSIDKFFYR